jgi:hypothetical protein
MLKREKEESRRAKIEADITQKMDEIIENSKKRLKTLHIQQLLELHIELHYPNNHKLINEKAQIMLAKYVEKKYNGITRHDGRSSFEKAMGLKYINVHPMKCESEFIFPILQQIEEKKHLIQPKAKSIGEVISRMDNPKRDLF